MFNKILPQKMVTSRYIVWWKLNLCFLYSHWKTVLKFYDVIKVLQRALQRLTKAAIVRKRSLIAIENIKDIKQAVESVFYGRQKNPRELEIVHSGCWWLTRNSILSNNITFNVPHRALTTSFHIRLFDRLAVRLEIISIRSSRSALYYSIFR